MPRTLTSLAGVLLLAGAATAPAFGQDAMPPAPPPPEMAAPEAPAEPDADAGPSHRLTGPAVVFNLIDRDRDGTIDMAEASILFESIFITLDSDDDGKLSKAEINAALQRMHGGMDRGGPRGGHHGPRGPRGEHHDD